MMQKSIRAVAILIYTGRLLVIHRIKNSKEYYVFPGGSVEDGETIKQAVLRELKEETSIDAEIKRLLYIHDYGLSKQYYYLCRYLDGFPKLEEGSIEEERNSNSQNDFYKPGWVDLCNLKSLLLYPLEIRDWLIQDLAQGFSQKLRKVEVDPSALRR